ncbi:MAG: winged helix-turn-helix domain-containing protein [Gammaproteobacteria bacterium]|nr:winged helix-turn-helix domain-containing protein [Gammaproteobacteria bacterium]
MTGPDKKGQFDFSAEAFRLGDWLVDPRADRISKNEQSVHIQPRVMKVLSLLAQHQGQVLSREKLEAEAWAGMVVGYDALASSIIKLRKALGDDSRNPRYIETVSKKGYRLMVPVNPVAATEQADKPNQKTALPSQKLFFAGIAALVIAVSIYLFVNPMDSGSSDGSQLKRLAILPFVNINKDHKQDYFVEGITDDINTDLSALSGIIVLSRSAVSRYRGQQIQPQVIRNELGADYLLEGSVRKSAKRWRINVKLIDASNGTNLWAKAYTHKETSLASAQDELTQNIVRALALQLTPADQNRLNKRPTTNFEAYELFLQGQKLFKIRSADANKRAQDAYRQAIKLDSKFARAHGALSVSLNVDYWRGWTDSPNETLNRAYTLAVLATELDPTSPQAFWALGYSLMYQKELVKAADAVKQAIKLAPNYADGYGLLALINNNRGKATEAIIYIKRGMQLNPHYTWDYPYNLGRSQYILGNYTEAIKNLLVALERNENAINPRIYLAATYAASGNLDDAKWEVEQIRISSPETSVDHIRNNIPITDKALMEKFIGHLIKAGLPATP